MKNPSIQLLCTTPLKSNFSYNTVLAIADAIALLAKVGWLPDTAPDPAKGTKIRYSAIARFVGHTAGWVGLAVKLHEQLEAYKSDAEVQRRLRSRHKWQVSVKTLLKVIKAAVDASANHNQARDADGEDDPAEDKEDEEDEEDKESSDEDDAKALVEYANKLAPRGVNYGQCIIDEPEEVADDKENVGGDSGAGLGRMSSASSGPAQKKCHTGRQRKANQDDHALQSPDL